MNLELEEVPVLVTGAGRGLGREIALAFAKEGAIVTICGRSPGPLESTAAELRQFGRPAHSIQANLTEPDACRAAVDRAADLMGGLAVLVNNASNDVLAAGSESDAAELMHQRLLGKAMLAVRCSEAARQHLQRAEFGSIVMIGGTAARQRFEPDELGTRSPTTAAGFGNAALVNYANHLAHELAPAGVRVNVVHPHAMRTDRYEGRVADTTVRTGRSRDDVEAELAARIPLGRVPSPGDVVPLVLLLASRVSAMTTGQSIAVDGGAIRGIGY